MLERFYLIIDDAGWLARFLPLGLKLVQLRLKDRDDVVSQIRSAKSQCEATGCQLIINDFWQEALDIGCDFVHLGQQDLDTADIGALRTAKVQLGISTHDEVELERALSLNPDYIALGPIYPTLLKAMSWAPQGLDKITAWKKAIGDIPLVAIGGLTVDRAVGAFAAGADSLCVVTDVLRATDPEGRLREWLDVTA